jgi:hypothetical protein
MVFNQRRSRKGIEKIGRCRVMSENKILEILGDIRYEMFDILADDDEKLEKVLKVIDWQMKDWRGKTNDDICNELMEEW